VVSRGYFPAFGIRLLRGRSFRADDRVGAPWVALVNRRFAEGHWPGADPIGHRLRFRDREWTIVGTVADVREMGAHAEAPAAIYVAATQWPHPWVRFAVRSERRLDQLGPEVRAAVASVAAHQPIASLQPLSAQAERGRRRSRVMAELFGLLALIAVALAVTGIYSVTSYLVAQRTAEIGIRRALGAGAPEIARMVMRTGALGLMVGGGVGLALAVAASRAIAAMLSLYRAAAFDPAVLGLVAAVLAGAAVAAMVAPMRRALRVDPLVAFRQE
jgi:hypothetical protein